MKYFIAYNLTKLLGIIMARKVRVTFTAEQSNEGVRSCYYSFLLLGPNEAVEKPDYDIGILQAYY